MTKITDLKWYQNYVEWEKYVKRYMRQAEKREDSLSITIRDKQSNVIAQWNKDGFGQIFEKRVNPR